jgi:DNA polymerase III delta prime subunit
MFRDPIHHAYVCIGDEAYFLDHIKELRGQIIKRNFDVFTIDDARESISLQSTTSQKDEKRFFVWSLNTLSVDAQHALLKVFEEPTEHTHFFIIIPQDTLLPTLKSRVVIVRGEQKGTSSDFLNMSVPERLAYIKKLTTSIQDEKAVKQDALELVYSLERTLHNKKTITTYEELNLCEQARKMLLMSGSMTKMILEDLAVRLG